MCICLAKNYIPDSAIPSSSAMHKYTKILNIFNDYKNNCY